MKSKHEGFSTLAPEKYSPQLSKNAVFLNNPCGTSGCSQ